MRLPILIIVLAAACAPRSAIPRPGTGREIPADEECMLPVGEATDAPAAARPSTVTIALADPVDPGHAAVPANDAERIVFAHLYETLVRVDCHGRVVPGLAGSWQSHDGGTRWTFRLRDDAQFWDGAPVAAQDVVFGKSGAGFTLSAIDGRTISVRLARGTDRVPAVLADPGLAVTKRSPDGSWPIGTGRYWVTSATATPEAIRAHGPGGDTLVFRIAASGDPRDLLDAGVDLLVTRDPALRDYAATQQRIAVLALPWDRSYVFVTPEPGGTRFDGLEQAVRGPARRAAAPFWWLDLGGACGHSTGMSPPEPAASAPRRIVYPREDPTARELAGRVAALTRGVAVARSAAAFAAALRAGRDWGYIVALPRLAPDPCRAARDLLPTWDATLTALIDSRADALVRRGGGRWLVEHDGTVRLVP